MVNIDIISNFNSNKNLKTQNFNGEISHLHISSNVIDYIISSNSECVLFLNKRDKINKNFILDSYTLSKENNFKYIVSPSNVTKLSVRGKLFPTKLLKEFYFKSGTKEFSEYDLYELLYNAKIISSENLKFKNSQKIFYKECSEDLIKTITKLDELEKHLKSNNIYNICEFKKIYIEEIIQKYMQFRNNRTIFYKGGNTNYFVLEILYIMMLSKFNDALDFLDELKKENNIDFDLNEDIKYIKCENLESISDNNKQKLKSLLPRISNF